MLLFGQTPFRNSITMATPEVPSDQKLFVTKFQLLHLTVSGRIKNPPGGEGGDFARPK